MHHIKVQWVPAATAWKSLELSLARAAKAFQLKRATPRFPRNAMSRIHFVVKETAKMAYQTQARREGKSLGEWLREAADEKLATARPRKFTVEELREFAARCDARHPPGAREMDWPEVKKILVETRYPDYDIT